MHEDGRGVAQDFSEAFRLFTLAAAQGHADAQHNLRIAADHTARRAAVLLDGDTTPTSINTTNPRKAGGL